MAEQAAILREPQDVRQDEVDKLFTGFFAGVVRPNRRARNGLLRRAGQWNAGNVHRREMAETVYSMARDER